MKKIIASIAGAVASFYAAKYVNQMLQEKPLKTRVREAKTKVADLKDQAASKFADAKAVATKKVNTLVDEQPHKDSDA